MSEEINNYEDILKMLDSFLRDEGQWWDKFYDNRERKIPFFINLPDESLVSFFQQGLLKPGRVLELGCGPGRNAIYMTKQGCRVDAVDISKEAIEWARERAENKGIPINFICTSIFEFLLENNTYDIVYDTGCFHHIPPHRRMSYIEIVKKALKTGGTFCLVCFTPEGGASLTDWEVYRQKNMSGGLGYTEKKLKEIFEKDFEIIQFRRMKNMEEKDQEFGVDYCWTCFMKLKYEKICI